MEKYNGTDCTVQYIVEQSKILSDEELIELIENFIYQEVEKALSNYWPDER